MAMVVRPNSSANRKVRIKRLKNKAYGKPEKGQGKHEKLVRLVTLGLTNRTMSQDMCTKPTNVFAALEKGAKIIVDTKYKRRVTEGQGGGSYLNRMPNRCKNLAAICRESRKTPVEFVSATISSARAA